MKHYQLATQPLGNPKSLEGVDAYDLTPIDHEYPGLFAKKANNVFRKLSLPLVFAMVIADPADACAVYEEFKNDPRYKGGGTGSGFKNKAPACLDSIDPLAEKIGAVNVVVKQDGHLRGYNTDGIGFVVGLKEMLKWERSITSLAGMNVLLLGAGGTADAIAFTLAEEKIVLNVVNRTANKAVALATRVSNLQGVQAKGFGESELPSLIGQADIIINASTKSAIGPYSEFAAFAPATAGDLETNLNLSARTIDLARRTAVVCDVNLREDGDISPTLHLAQQYGLLTQDGQAMNFHQAVEALWLLHRDMFKQKGLDKLTLAKLLDTTEV